MRPTVVAAALFPGIARAISPVVRALFDGGWHGCLVTTRAALPVVNRHRFEPEQVVITDRTPLDPETVIRHHQPGLFVAGIAEWTATERQWLSTVRRHRIPSLGVLDMWGEYEVRIDGASVAADEFTDVLAVMNERVRAHVARACSWPKIVATGNPGVEEFFAIGDDDTTVSRARETLGIAPSRRVVSFFSQPIAQKLGVTIGYTQYDALKTLLRHTNPSTWVLVAAHALEEVAAIERATHESLTGRGRILTEYDPKVVFAASDLVASCFSNSLLEAALALRPTVSVQPGLTGRNRCWSAMLGVSEIAVTETEVPAAIGRAMAAGQSRAEMLRRRDLIDLEPGAIDRLVAIAAELAGSVDVVGRNTHV